MKIRNPFTGPGRYGPSLPPLREAPRPSSDFELDLDGSKNQSISVWLVDPNAQRALSCRRRLYRVLGDQVTIRLTCDVDRGIAALRVHRVDVTLLAIDELQMVGEAERVVSRMASAASHSGGQVIAVGCEESAERAASACRAGADEYLFRPEVSSCALGRMIRCAYERARRGRMLWEDATHDELTGVANRRLLRRYFDSVRDGRGRGDFPRMGVVMVDLDGLKAINDEHGHEMGDQALQAVAARLESHVRPRDLVARVGGDEFVVMVHGTESPEEVQGICDRVGAAVCEPFALDGLPLRLRASVGIAMADGRERPELIDLLGEADRAMYRDKRERGSYPPGLGE